MALDILLSKLGNKLVPMDDLAEEDLSALPEGKPLMAKVSLSRSLPQHRLLFKLIRETAKACPTPVSENALRQWLTVRTGHVDHLPLGFGQSYAAPRSWAFDKMDQTEFRKLFDDVVQLILTEIAPGLPEGFTDQFLAILDGRDAAGANNAPAAAA